MLTIPIWLFVVCIFLVLALGIVAGTYLLQLYYKHTVDTALVIEHDSTGEVYPYFKSTKPIEEISQRTCMMIYVLDEKIKPYSESNK